MACALPFKGEFSAASLRRFATERLLRLPLLPPISPRLLAAWRHAGASAGHAVDGGVAVLALLPEGPQPLRLLAAIAGARQHLQAVAAAVWR